MIIVTYPQQIPNETEIINALFDEGLETLHLRKPELNKEQLIEFISKIDNCFQSRIMLHNHYELLDSFGLKGLHFTEKTKNLLPYYDYIHCTKSMAMHELDELKSLHPTVNYIVLSPLFPSVSKEGYSKQWIFEEVRLGLEKKYSFDIVALGGITLENVQKVKELGFHDFALLGSIWEPVKAGCTVKEVIRIFNSFKR